MAKENNDQQSEQASVQVQPKVQPISDLTKVLLLIAAAMLVLAMAITATLYALGVFDSAAADLEAFDDTPGQQMTDGKPKSAMYFPIKPAFVVNFSTPGRQRFMQVEITVLTREMDVFNALQTHMPLIKNRLVMLFSGEIYDELQTNEGKELLRLKALDAMQQVMQQEIAKPGVEEVLFTSFVMQ